MWDSGGSIPPPFTKTLNLTAMKELFEIINASGKHTEGFTLSDRTIGFAVIAGLVIISFLANI